VLTYAILALLRDGADHGYRLRQRLDRMLRPVWQVNIGQVYQILDRLRRAGWVEELPPETDRLRGHERWPVAITPSGRDELDRWLLGAIRPSRPPRPVRHEILGRLTVGGDRCADEVLRGIGVERALYAREYEDMVSRCQALAHATKAADSAKYLALQASRLGIRAHLEWLDVCFAHLRARGYTARAEKGNQATGAGRVL